MQLIIHHGCVPSLHTLIQESENNMANTKSGGGSNTKEKNGAGNSKPILTSEEQNEIRRAKKKRQSMGTGSGSARHEQTGYLAGIEQDKLKADALYLFDALYPVMNSSSPSIDAIVKSAFSTFITEYTDVSIQELRRLKLYRNQFALERALSMIGDARVEEFVRARIEYACRSLHFMKKNA